MSNTYSGENTPIPCDLSDLKAEISKHFWNDFIAGRKIIKMNNSCLDKHLAIPTN